MEWDIDVLKISYQDSNIVDHVIDLLDSELGKENPLTKESNET